MLMCWTFLAMVLHNNSGSFANSMEGINKPYVTIFSYQRIYHTRKKY